MNGSSERVRGCVGRCSVCCSTRRRSLTSTKVGNAMQLMYHIRSLCLATHTDEVDRLKEHIEEKETELMDMRVKLQGLERQVVSLEVRFAPMPSDCV